jgi:DNA invertase Pin-like site-specific DNA recombinase
VDQSESGCSLVLQREKIEGYCKLHELELLHVYEDAGRSAKNINGRPAFVECLEFLRAKKADGLVCYKLDRAFRSTTDCLETVEMLKKKGLEFVSITENVSTDGAIGTLFVSILASLSAFERQLTSERTSQALQGKIQRGERTGTLRYGYDLDLDGVHLIPNPEEQQVLTKIQRYRAKGVSLRQIAEKLNKQGCKTKQGGSWKHSTVQGLVNRQAV